MQKMNEKMKKMLKRIIFVLLVFGFFSPLYGASVQEVTTYALNVRTGPSSGYRRIGSIYRGQKYVAITGSNGWSKIWFGGRSGWCSGKYLKTVSGLTGLRINISSLNVRRGPSTGYGIVGRAHNPETYVIIARNGVWRKIWFAGAPRWCYAGSYASEVSLGGTTTPAPRPTPTPQPPVRPNPRPNPNTGQYQWVKAVDISHWSGKISNYTVNYWKNHGVKHVIAGTQRESITRQQLQTAVNNGVSVDAYVFLYFSKNMTSQVKEALRRVRGMPITRLWLDIEAKTNGLSRSQVKAKIWEAIRACGSVPYGIYTGGWWWKDKVRNTTDFAQVPLWYSRYDKNPSLSTWSWQKFGGWQNPWGKQYQGTTKFGGVVVDLNTMKVPTRRRNP